MTHAQLNATGRRRDCAASWRVGKLFDAPLFAVSRKELLKAARDAVRALALDRSERQLVECLAVCFGEQQLAHGLLCWPSNAQIEKKTGMSERTIRRTIVKLRERGLILMRDSANGKRFPISNAEGEVVDARGFDLTPLHARAAEFAERARALDIEDRVRRQLRDDLTAARNALLDLCAEDPSGVYAEILARAKIVARPSKAATPEEYAAAIEAYVALAEEAREIRYRSDPSTQTPGSAGHPGRHSEQNSKPSIEDCNAPRHDSPSPFDRSDDSSNEAFREGRGGDVRLNERTLETARPSHPQGPRPLARRLPRALGMGNSHDDRARRDPGRSVNSGLWARSARLRTRPRRVSALSTPACLVSLSFSVMPMGNGAAARRYALRVGYSSCSPARSSVAAIRSRRS